MQCAFCGKNFLQVRGTNIFCSQKCAAASFRKKRKQEDPDYKKGVRRAKSCKNCQCDFETTNAVKVFCGNPCKVAWNNANRETSGPQEITCGTCGKSFVEPRKSGVGKRYCSKLCATRSRKSKHHPLRQTFDGMWSRCINPNDTSYPRYGADGVTVCETWKSFEQFCKDMGAKPSPKHSIDRIDNSLGYSPENCRWATAKQQSRNRRNVIDQNLANTIKELFKLGKSNKEISALMAIRYETVWRITAGYAWLDD